MRISRDLLIFCLIPGIAIRLLLAPLSGHPWDLFVWYDTGTRLVAGGSLYEVQSFGAGYAYPPGWGLMLGLTSLVHSMLSSLFDVRALTSYEAGLILGTSRILGAPLVPDWLFALTAKIPIIIFDALLAILVYDVARRRLDERQAIWASMLVFLNPYTILITGIWGMFDAIPAFLALFGTLRLVDRRGLSGGILFGLGTVFKYYPALILLIVALGYMPRLRGRVLMRTLAGFTVVVVGFSIPFLVQDWSGYLQGITSPASALYLGNMSIWVIAAALGANLSLAVGAIVVGAIAIACAMLGWGVGRTRIPSDEEHWILLSSAAVLLILVFFRTVNEQYFLWLLPYLALRVAMKRERLAFVVLLSGLAFTHAWLNLGQSSFFLPALTVSSDLRWLVPFLPEAMIALGVIGIAFWITSVVLLARTIKALGGIRPIGGVFREAWRRGIEWIVGASRSFRVVGGEEDRRK